MAKVIVANPSTLDLDYYYCGLSKDGSIVQLTRYFEEAVFFNDDELLHNIFMKCLQQFGYVDCIDWRIDEVEV